MLVRGWFEVRFGFESCFELGFGFGHVELGLGLGFGFDLWFGFEFLISRFCFQGFVFDMLVSGLGSVFSLEELLR